MKDNKKPNKETKNRIRRFQRFLDKFRKKTEKIKDAKGNEIPISNLTQLQIARQAVSEYLKIKHQKIHKLHTELAAEHNDILENYRAWRFSNYNPRESKNNDISITSHDGQIKVARKKNFTIMFSRDSIEEAQDLMMPLVLDGTKSVDANLRGLVVTAFSPASASKSGVSMQMLLDYHWNNPRWKAGQQALISGKQVIPGKSSLTVELKNSLDAWELIPTGLTSIKLPEEKE